MNSFAVISLLLLLLFSTFSMLLQVNAQPPDYSNLEELLRLAKEKLQQIKPEYNYSNMTLDQFSNELSNITLNQEQVKEFEADPQFIVNQCIQRMGLKEDPGKLCDAFADYQVDKCKKFDNLLRSCLSGLIGEYESTRNLQLSCEKSPPLYNDTIRIKICQIVIPLNSSYTARTVAANLSATITDKSSSVIKIRLVAENLGDIPITFVNMTYSLFENASKLTDGCIAYPLPCKTLASGSVKASGIVNPLSSADYEFEYHSNATQNQTLIGPFVLNGTYYYHFPNSKTTGQDFDFKVIQKKCEIISLDC